MKNLKHTLGILTEFFQDNNLFLRNLMRKIIWVLFFLSVIIIAVSTVLFGELGIVLGFIS